MSTVEQGSITSDAKERRHAVPVLYVRGSNYDVGYDIGRTFRSLIEGFMMRCEKLNQFLQEYETPIGKAAYETTLANMKQRYPHYVKEIQGVADGASVPFHKLFLLQMDDIIETINGNSVPDKPIGCSSIAFKNMNESVLGHTEDAFSETLNHFYILSAHVLPTPEDIEAGAREERFASLCYAGHLPGYTMGFNHHGLVFSVNTLSPKDLLPGRTPRTFITRALLSATDFSDAEAIIRDKGLGASNGCSMNIFFTQPGRDHLTLHNVEMAPNPKLNESMVNIEPYESDKQYLMHCNKYQRLKVAEVIGPIIDSSDARMCILSKYPQPATKSDVITMLSDGSGKIYKVFGNQQDNMIRTIAVGIFDLNEKTWSLYTDKPNSTEPIAVLPMFY